MNNQLTTDFWSRIEEAPHQHSFYQLLRRFDARINMPHRLGRNYSPSHEPIRLKQEPTMAFAPSSISRVERREGMNPAISFLHFGLFGPNGPLPLHLTELARERLIHHQDSTLTAFADMFHHRLLCLFYRAWADAQACVSLDHGDEKFSQYIASLIHIGLPAFQGKDTLNHHSKLFFAGHFSRECRNPEGLTNILQTFFNIKVSLKEFVVDWIPIPTQQQSRLGSQHGLGKSTILGRAVRDAQHKFQLILGPLTEQQYYSFLPMQPNAKQLVDWVHQYIGIEFDWEAILVLKKDEVRGLQLGQAKPLGMATWLGHRPQNYGDARDLIIRYDPSL